MSQAEPTTQASTKHRIGEDDPSMDGVLAIIRRSHEDSNELLRRALTREEFYYRERLQRMEDLNGLLTARLERLEATIEAQAELLHRLSLDRAAAGRFPLAGVNGDHSAEVIPLFLVAR